MIRVVAVYVLLAPVFVLASNAQGTKDDKASQIRKQIADLKAKLAELEGQLAQLEGGKYVGPLKEAASKGASPTYSLKYGDIGGFGPHTYYVDNVDTENSVVLRIANFRFMIIGVDTNQLTTGAAVQMKGEWEVGKTISVSGRTIHTVTPKSSADLVIK